MVHYIEAYEVNYHQMTLAHLLLMVIVGNLGFTHVIDFGMHLKKHFYQLWSKILQSLSPSALTYD